MHVVCVRLGLLLNASAARQQLWFMSETFIVVCLAIGAVVRLEVETLTAWVLNQGCRMTGIESLSRTFRTIWFPCRSAKQAGQWRRKFANPVGMNGASLCSGTGLGNIYPVLKVCHVKQCLHCCLSLNAVDSLCQGRGLGPMLDNPFSWGIKGIQTKCRGQSHCV